MKTAFHVFVFLCAIKTVFAQEPQIAIQGKILDARTGEPLSNVSVQVKAQALELVSAVDGTFAFTLSAAQNDTLEVSHVGYRTVKKKIAGLESPVIIQLHDLSVELRPVTVNSRRFNLKEIDRSWRPIKGNLYAYETEITNGLYNLFLTDLEERGDRDQLKRCAYHLSHYDEKTRAYYEAYSAPYRPSGKKDTLREDYSAFPAVNICHEAAVLFCHWLTEKYNASTGKKKFSRIKVRLPTVKEWQIAALGYSRFQSWVLDENTVEVVIPDDTVSVIVKGPKTTLAVKGEIFYPWWNVYNYRKKVQNQKGCYMGNFKIPPTASHCPTPKPGHDGWTMMAHVANYFPNMIGLYDMVGNVAEMVDEKGKACGGSWDDAPRASTIRSIKTYTRPDASIGFRVFMEVLSD